MAQIVKANGRAIETAVELLRAGKVVAFPTETVYGIGADTHNLSAISAVYRIKGRPADNPLSAHVADVEQGKPLVSQWTDEHQRLAGAFWPGPLALILPKHPDLDPAVTAGRDTISLRCPQHPVALQLLRQFGGPVSATSANRSGGLSPTSAQHVADDFSSQEDLFILDGGPCPIGIESTVLDLTGPEAHILRSGAIGPGELIEAGLKLHSHAPPGGGRVAPRKPVELIQPDHLYERLERADNSEESLAVLCQDTIVISTLHEVIFMPREDVDYAQQLYDALRDADASAAQIIVVVCPPDTSELWRAVIHRIQQAAASLPG